MNEEKYITSNCSFSNNAVYKNGKSLYENKDAVLNDFLISTYHHFEIKYPKFYKMDNLSKLGWIAAEVLLKDNVLNEKYTPGDIGIVLSNANASLDTDIKYYKTAQDIASPALFVYTLPNIVIGEICIRHKFKGENAFFISEKFDAEFLEQYVNNLINNNILQACICGWIELLEEEYKAVLFLVEKNQTKAAVPFTKENLNKIYHL